MSLANDGYEETLKPVVKSGGPEMAPSLTRMLHGPSHEWRGKIKAVPGNWVKIDSMDRNREEIASVYHIRLDGLRSVEERDDSVCFLYENRQEVTVPRPKVRFSEAVKIG